MNIRRFIDWAKNGRRNVSVSYDSRNPEPSGVWCYDYDISEGALLGFDDDPPTKDELLFMKKKRLEKEEAWMKSFIENE
jgi:hypothetical protein